MLLLTCVVVVLAFVLRVRPDQRVAVVGLEGLPLPPMCGSQQLFGVRCPGCGLTRSFVLLAQGDWNAAWQAHRLGWLLALALLAQVPYRWYLLWRQQPLPWPEWTPNVFSYVLIVLLIGNWLLDTN